MDGTARSDRGRAPRWTVAVALAGLLGGCTGAGEAARASSPTAAPPPTPAIVAGEVPPATIDVPAAPYGDFRPAPVEIVTVDAWPERAPLACGDLVDALAPGVTARGMNDLLPTIEHMVVDAGYPSTNEVIWHRNPVAGGVHRVAPWHSVGLLTYIDWPGEAPEDWGVRTELALVDADGRVAALATETASLAPRGGLRHSQKGGPGAWAPEEILPALDVTVWGSGLAEGDCDGSWRDGEFGAGPFTLMAVTEVWSFFPGEVIALAVDTGNVSDVTLVGSWAEGPTDATGASEPTGAPAADVAAVREARLAGGGAFEGAGLREASARCARVEAVAGGIDALEALPVTAPATLPTVERASDHFTDGDRTVGLVEPDGAVVEWWADQAAELWFFDAAGSLASIAAEGPVGAHEPQAFFDDRDDLVGQIGRMEWAPFVPFAEEPWCGVPAGAPLEPGTYRPVVVVTGRHAHPEIGIDASLATAVAELWVELPPFAVE